VDGEPGNERRRKPKDEAGRLAELVLRPTGEYQDGAAEVLDAGYGLERRHPAQFYLLHETRKVANTVFAFQGLELLAGPPIMIIRHGEKPRKSPGKKGPSDVLLDGQFGDGKSFVLLGWKRVGALTAFFASCRGKPANPKIATRNYTYAANPEG